MRPIDKLEQELEMEVDMNAKVISGKWGDMCDSEDAERTNSTLRWVLYRIEELKHDTSELEHNDK